MRSASAPSPSINRTSGRLRGPFNSCSSPPGNPRAEPRRSATSRPRATTRRQHPVGKHFVADDIFHVIVEDTGQDIRIASPLRELDSRQSILLGIDERRHRGGSRRQTSRRRTIRSKQSRSAGQGARWLSICMHASGSSARTGTPPESVPRVPQSR